MRLPEPAADYDENAPPESWRGAVAVNRARGESEAAAEDRLEQPHAADVGRHQGGGCDEAGGAQLAGVPSPRQQAATLGRVRCQRRHVRRDEVTRPAFGHGPDATGTDGAREIRAECSDDG